MEIEEKARNVPTIHYHLGMVYLGLGEKGKANNYLQMAVKSKEDFQGKKEAEKILKELG